MYPYSNLERSLICSLIFLERSFYLKNNVERTFEFASNSFQDLPLLKFRKVLIRSLIFIECSLYLKKNVDWNFQFSASRFQDLTLLKFRNFPDSLSYSY